MNTVTLHGGMLTIEPRGLDKLWSFARELSFPVSHVVDAEWNPAASYQPKGWCAAGLRFRHKASGTFRRRGVTTFWNVSNSRNNIVIRLREEKYVTLILTVADPAVVIRAINAALAESTTT